MRPPRLIVQMMFETIFIVFVGVSVVLTSIMGVRMLSSLIGEVNHLRQHSFELGNTVKELGAGLFKEMKSIAEWQPAVDWATVKFTELRLMRQSFAGHEFVRHVLTVFSEYDENLDESWLMRSYGTELSAFVAAKVRTYGLNRSDLETYVQFLMAVVIVSEESL